MFMHPFGKTIKTACMNRRSEKGSIEVLLQNYRDTQHPATPSLCFLGESVQASPGKMSKTNTFREPERKTGQKSRKEQTRLIPQYLKNRIS